MVIEWEDLLWIKFVQTQSNVNRTQWYVNGTQSKNNCNKFLEFDCVWLIWLMELECLINVINLSNVQLIWLNLIIEKKMITFA